MLRPSGVHPLPEALALREESAAKLTGIAFLYKSYKPDAWWFELFETARRLLLTGFLVLFMAGSASQITLALLVMQVSIVVCSRVKPFLNEHDEQLHLTAQMQTFLALLAGLLIQVVPHTRLNSACMLKFQ